MINERWASCLGFSGRYEVSDLGRVRSITHQTIRGIRVAKIKKVRPDKDGYEITDLWVKDQRHTKRVHRLVLEAFVGQCLAGYEACHYPDPDKTNNKLSNLRWGTSSENSYDSVKHGTHPRLKFSNEDVCRIFELRNHGMPHRQVAEIIGCSKVYVEKILYGKLRQQIGKNHGNKAAIRISGTGPVSIYTAETE